MLVGNFMGDFVKGPLLDRFPEEIRRGVQLHRLIDSYAERHPQFRRSRLRIDSEFGRYRGIMVDLFYDHLLVNDWSTWSREPLDLFLERTRRVIDAHHRELPGDLAPLVPVIFDDLIPSYGTIAGIGTACRRMSRRLRRPNPLGEAERELLRLRDDLMEDFSGFTPQIICYASSVMSGFLDDP
jgi:acyl carrier protein phosphodiesterase